MKRLGPDAMSTRAQSLACWAGKVERLAWFRSIEFASRTSSSIDCRFLPSPTLGRAPLATPSLS